MIVTVDELVERLVVPSTTVGRNLVWLEAAGHAETSKKGESFVAQVNGEAREITSGDRRP